MRVNIEEVPMEIRRRVANKLESIRGTPMAPGGGKMWFGEKACPLYRPDMKGIAYWEFEITGLREVRPREHNGKSSGVGFIIAATGSHDIPIPHWSVTREAPSRALEAKIPQAQISRVYKLDTLSYSSEDANGKYLAHIGQFPVQISGISGDVSKYRGIVTANAAPKDPVKDDSKLSKHILKIDGSKPAKIKIGAWESWSAAKKGFSKTFRPHLDALASRSLEAWKVEDMISRYGEGILEGQSLTIPFLKPGKFKIAGDAEKFLKVENVETPVSAAKMTALPTGDNKELNFQLTISYKDGTSECLRFFIVPKGTPSNNRSVLPHLSPIINQ
jgi:hypothetical protein